jgi:beta-lactamase regulating signal transducer with metallopeptidase domain
MTDWITDTLVATSLLMAFVLLAREPVRRQFGPAIAYGLWLIPVLRLAMPPLTTTVERTVPAGAALPLSIDKPAQASFVAAVDPGLVDQLGGWQTLALCAWLAGAAAMLIGGMLIYRAQRREVLRDSVEIGRLRNIRIVSSGAVRGPVAFGIFDRVMALPTDFEERFDPGERRLALAHELSHHRSGDLIVNHFAFALLSLQWFNPLAWLSHAAFRFDQEAACDARVLDTASGRNRAAYAQAIAKAASGRALLFAGALDRPRTLQKRLRSMLTRPSPGRRIAGKALVALTATAALPLTASWATHYVDVPRSAPPAATAKGERPATPGGHAALAPALGAPIIAASATASPAPVRENGDGSVTLAGGVRLGRESIAFFANDDVLIDGKVKRLEQLTSAERAKLRATILRAQREQARRRLDLPRELAELRREADRARSGEMRREHVRDIAELRRDLEEVDSRAAELRAEGDDPAKRKAELLRDLREAEATDVASEEREAIDEADPAKVVAELRSEEQQMARMLARLDQLGRR